MSIDVRAALSHLTLSVVRKVDITTPLLSKAEVSEEPIKWLKYLVMDRVGIEPIEKIAQQIRRFRLSTITEAQRWVHTTLEQISHLPHQSPLIVIKVIPWDTGAQLRNYRIQKISDIQPVFETLNQVYRGLDHELWCCQSSVSRSGFNLGGRLAMPQSRGEQVLELVWYASPRTLESVCLPEFSLPYLRAIKKQAADLFDIVSLHIPKLYENTCQQLWTDDFRWVAMELRTRRKSMEILRTILSTIGAREVCFCFKVCDGRLTIIDWDTEIESTARRTDDL